MIRRRLSRLFAAAAKDKPLGRFEHHVDQLHRLLEGSATVKSHEEEAKNEWIVREIRKILDKRILAHSSQNDLKRHFDELFSGIGSLTASNEALANANTTKDRIAIIVAPKNSESQIRELFDTLYYRGEATYALTTAVLADNRVGNETVNHIIRAVIGGGTVLRAWSTSQRALFRLHVVNKLWVVGRRAEAKQRLELDWDNFFQPILDRSSDPKVDRQASNNVRLLIRALVVVLPDNNDLVHRVAKHACTTVNWPVLYRLWFTCVQTCRSLSVLDTISDCDMPLSQALKYVALAFTEKDVPQYLDIVPTSIVDVQRALLKHARHARDVHLLDLVDDARYSHENALTGAQIAALRIAIDH